MLETGAADIDHQSLGIVQLKHLVFRRATEIKHHAGMIRRPPQTNIFDVGGKTRRTYQQRQQQNQQAVHCFHYDFSPSERVVSSAHPVP